MSQKWHEETTASGDVYLVVPGSGGCQYLVGNRTLTNGIDEDNVRLLVNAARLLEACKSGLGAIQVMRLAANPSLQNAPPLLEVVKMMRAAIAAAKPEEEWCTTALWSD